MSVTADDLIELLELRPLTAEGGWWAQTWLDRNGSAIYYLMRPGDFSQLHRLGGPELWHFYAGDPVQLVLLHPDGSSTLPILFSDFEGGSRPVAAVPAGTWMGAFTTGQWSLVGTTMAPPFDENTFETMSRRDAVVHYPEVATEIQQVTRQEDQ
jgi:predicted cupin superfamily sugar epimerase